MNGALTGALAEALAKVQAVIPHVAKDNVGRVKSEKANYTYNYADLADVTPAILPLLGQHGLSWSTLPTMVTREDGRREFVLRYLLMHQSGESLEGEWLLPDPQRTPPQQIGIHITYARRYSLCAVTGVAPGGDDNDASAAHPASYQPEQQPRRPTYNWAAAIAAAETARDDERLRELWLKAEGLEDVRADVVAAFGRVGKASAKTDPPKEPDTATPKVDRKRLNHLFALLGEAGLGDKDTDTRAKRLRICQIIADRDDLTTSSDLTADEAAVVIDTLRGYGADAGQRVTDLLEEDAQRSAWDDRPQGDEAAAGES